jgi:uncharacterized LabA/DUF88 family protein
MKVALIVDTPNLMGMTNALDKNIDFKAFLKSIQHVRGQNRQLVIKKAFYDAPRHSTNTNPFIHALGDFGLELIQVPLKSYAPDCPGPKIFKSRTDQQITIHIMNHLQDDDFDHLILVSGDSDYEFVLKECKHRGKTIEIWGTQFIIAHDLKRIADSVNFFDDSQNKHMLIQKRQKYAA